MQRRADDSFASAPRKGTPTPYGRALFDAPVWYALCSPPWVRRVRMPIRTTLLELVEAVSEFADNEAEVIATVVHMVNSGEVELCGTFRGQRFAADVAYAA